MRQAMNFRSSILVLVMALVLAAPLVAQNSGSIQGTVVDSAGAVIPGATVQALDQEKGTVTHETKSGADGLFLLQPLQPGIYAVIVKAAGMKELRRNDVHLDPYQKLDIGQLSTAVGAATESVTVEATTPLVETATADHSSVIDSKQVTDTLLNGRDFAELMKTLPGVISNNPADFQLQFNNTDQLHINGLRGSDNNVFLDGAINTDVGANDGQFTQLSMDAVGEFKVQTGNFAAEYGRNPGVFIAINTKSGTNKFHGTLYEFNRQSGFNAANFNTPRAPYLRFNQFGGNIGGPIPMPHAKNKMFFFANLEWTRGLKPGNTQFANKTLTGVGQGYNLPDPSWIGLGTTNPGAYDFTSAYQYCAPNNPNCTAGDPVLLPNGYNAGQIFVPGSITTRDSGGRPTNGTPICGTDIATACNIIPANSPFMSAQAPAWVNYWKPHYLPGTVTDPTSTNNRPASLGGPLNSKVFVPFNETYTLYKHQEVIRYDWNVNSKTNFFFRWVDDSQTESYHNLFDFADYPILPEYRKKPGSSWSWNLVNTLSPTMTNEFIFSYNHLTQVVDIQPGTPKSTYDRDLLGFTFQQIFPNANVDNRAPVLNNCCNGTFSGGSFRPSWHSEARQFTWTDNVTKVIGPHIFKFGAFYDYNQAGQQPSWNDTTFLSFTPGGGYPDDTNSYVANVLSGNYASVSQSNGIFFGAFRFHQAELFAQDTWKVSRKLTLDYGLRWAYLGPTYTVQPFFQNYFDPNLYQASQAVTIQTAVGSCPDGSGTAQTIGSDCPGTGNPYNGIVQEGHGGIPQGFAKHRYNNFGPRFGFSYDPGGNGKTAIRGGVGIFYERIRQNVNSFDALGNPPLTYTPTAFNGQLDKLSSALASGPRFPVGLNAFDKNGQIPTIIGYNVGVQHELPGRIGLDVAFVGNQGRHSQYQYNLEALPVGSVLDLNGLPQPSFAPFKGYTFINFTKYGANSSYKSLQIKAMRRFHRDLTLTADYVLSRAMDLEDNDNGNINSTNAGGNALTDPFNPGRDWAPAGFDRTHAFNLNYIYNIPYHGTGPMKYLLGGWEWGGLWKWWSGAPLDVTINGNAGNFVGVVRPDLDKTNTNVYISNSAHVKWLNPLAFDRPADGTVGSVRRNAFRGPGINNWNMSLFKNVNFTESTYIQFRVETYNTFNHPQMTGVNVQFTGANTIGQPVANPGTLGQINGYRDARAFQLAAKFYF